MKFFVTSQISENMYETPEGFLVCVGVPVARTGIQEYGEGETPLETVNGKIEIYRDEKEVFRPETIASFAGKAITISHPVDFVTPENWSVLSKGVLQNPRRGTGEQKDDLICDLLITEQTAIGAVKNGLREVSCGYTADYDQTEPGKGVQRNIIGNHLALVDQGRAGSRYAIHDHKGEKKMKLKDRIKSIFAKAETDAKAVYAKAQDEAMKFADENPDPDKDKAKDEEMSSMDELKQKVSDLEEKIKVLSGDADEDKEDSKDADEDKEDKKDKEDSKDGDQESEILSRIKALETAVSKMMSKDSDEDGDDDKSEDADKDDDESEDDDFEESSMVGDTASRAEILAPGIDVDAKDVKVKALKAAYATKEGKKVIDSLNGGKKPTFDSKEKVAVLFVAASEVLKAQRTDELGKSKRTKDGSGNGHADDGAITPDKLNEINAKFYNQA